MIPIDGGDGYRLSGGRRGGCQRFGGSGINVVTLLVVRVKSWPIWGVERLWTDGVEVWKWQVFVAESRLAIHTPRKTHHIVV